MSLFAAVHVPSLQIQLLEASLPALRGCNWVLGLQQDGSRAKVQDASSGAKGLGIEAGMPLAEVRRSFPSAQILAPDAAQLSRFRRVLSALCDARSSLWEVHDDGDATLDLGPIQHLVGSDLSSWAHQFRLDLEHSVAIRNARIVFAPTRDGAETLVRLLHDRESEHVQEAQLEERLGCVPLDAIAWLGRSTRDQLSRFRLRLLSDVRRVPHAFLCQHFGEVGERLSALARGVETRAGKSMTPTLAEEHVFQGGECGSPAARERVHELADRLSFALRERQLAAREVRLRLSWTDGRELSSTAQAVPACTNFLELRGVAWKLLSEIAVRRQPLRSLRLSIPRTETVPVQEDLFSFGGSPSLHPERERGSSRSPRARRLVRA